MNINQKNVLIHLKRMNPPKLKMSSMVTIYALVDDNINDNWELSHEKIPEYIDALRKLDNKQEIEVLLAFAQWLSNNEN